MDLAIEGGCPECGGPYEAGLWDRSHTCGYCESLLVLTRDEARDVYVVSDADPDPERALQILMRHEAEAYRARLVARHHNDSPLAFEPPSFERKVAAFCRRLSGDLELLERVEFFVPYRILDQAVAQGVLGRRALAKESYLQLFHSEELARRYDPRAYHLRDRGLKIRGLRLERLDARHLELAQGRFLPLHEPEQPESEIELDRTRARLHRETQVISKLCGTWRTRELTVYKHLTYARISRGRGEEHYLLDRQFGTIAARLDAAEAQTYRRLDQSRSTTSPLPPRSQAHVLAAECPNCGWDLTLGDRDLICFCKTCHHAIAIRDKRLELVPYGVGPAPEDVPCDTLVYFPFWAFPFKLQVSERSFTRIRDWLEAVSPQPHLERLAQSDPEQSTFFIPARSLYGSPEADAAFELLVGWTGWRQPLLRPERPTPNDRALYPGVDVAPEEAAALARYALVALHDNSSTRRLNGRSFRELIADAELRLGSPSLALLPLPIHRDQWRPAGLRQGVAGGLLRGDVQLAQISLTHGLRPRSS